jgi:O-antigen/teichoic acid export membrane protein
MLQLLQMDPSDTVETTSEISLETVKSRSVRGVITLTGRYFVLYGISFVAQAFLGAFLSIAEFGIFSIVSAVVNFLVYFSDIGLAASLIQKKEKPTDKDLITTFTVQQILIITLIILVLVFSPNIKTFYSLNQSAVYLMYALCFSLFASSIKTIPSVLLERKLQFEKLALSHILENLIYNALLVYLAWKGYGITSFTIAVVARSVVGVASIYTLSPWIPRLGISLSSLTHLLKFGIPYQFNTLIAVAKDDGLILFLGKAIGIEGIGILNWAQKWAQMPLRLFMDTVTKVTFPAFARLQDHKAELSRAVTRSVFFICFLVFPTIIGLITIAPLLVQVIPRYSKWEIALIPLTILSINTIFAAVSTQLTNLLSAIGKIKITSMFMIFWAVLSWLVIPLMAKTGGVEGAAWGYSIVGMSSILPIIIVWREVNFSISYSILRPLIASLAMGALVAFTRSLLPIEIYSCFILIMLGMATYAVIMVIFTGMSLIEDAQKAVKTIFNR